MSALLESLLTPLQRAQCCANDDAMRVDDERFVHAGPAALVSVVFVSAAGWHQRSLSLAAWGRARAYIERCDFVHAVLVGGLT